jgi:hypothetical protein
MSNILTTSHTYRIRVGYGSGRNRHGDATPPATNALMLDPMLADKNTVPNDSAQLVVLSHHKCATVWLLAVLQGQADITGASLWASHRTTDEPSDADLVFQRNAEHATAVAQRVFGVHVIRNPLDLVVSAYYSHRTPTRSTGGRSSSASAARSPGSISPPDLRQPCASSNGPTSMRPLRDRSTPAMHRRRIHGYLGAELVRQSLRWARPR